MFGRGYWGRRYWGEEYWPTGTSGVIPPTPPAQAQPGGPRPKRKFILDHLPERKRREPAERREPRQRRVPAVHVGLSLPLPIPVLALSVASPAPVMAQMVLPRVAPPLPSLMVRVRTKLELAEDRIDELEAVLAAVLED